MTDGEADFDKPPNKNAHLRTMVAKYLCLWFFIVFIMFMAKWISKRLVAAIFINNEEKQSES